MLEHGLGASIIGLLIITAILTYKYWGDGIYALTKNWRGILLIAAMCLIGVIIVVKQQDWKYDIAFRHFTGTKNMGEPESRYQIRLCKEFIYAKAHNETTEDYKKVMAGFIQIGKISRWDTCARTFALNYWQHDLTIEDKDGTEKPGGQMLCDTYKKTTYRSSRVDEWCKTVLTNR